MKNAFKIEEYINNINNGKVKNQKTDIGGTLDKRFVRVDSRFLKNMFKEISRNPKSSYVTYLNDFIVNNQSILLTKPCIEFTSALLKEDCRHGYKIFPDQFYSEVCASRLGNAMGYPVVYNQLYTDKYNDHFLVSVDFVGNNGNIINFDEFINGRICLGLNIKDADWSISLENWIRLLNYAFNTHQLFKENKISNEDREQICKDFVSLYLFRQFALNDIDFKALNLALIYNDKLNKYSLAPNFDMEMCFKPARAKDYDCEFSMVNIDYCNDQYPEILKDFIVRMKNITDKKKITKLFKDEVPDDDVLKVFVSNTVDNANRFLNYYNEFNSEMSEINTHN